MPAPELTCQAVEDQDLDTRYLAGQLPDEVAEAFESHYFGCDRCWELVHGGLEVRAATRGPRGAARARRWRAWWPLAAAAGVTGLALGVWRVTTSGPGLPPSTLRGAADSVTVRPEPSGSTLGVRWSPVPGADVYQVRLYDATGRVLLERQVADTTLRIARDAIPTPPRSSPTYWDVVALDALRRVIARSGAVRADGAGPP